MHELTMNDFFCGCGGMAVGFKNAGYRVVGAWDFDKYAVQSYQKNVGGHVKEADIREMSWRDIPMATVWAFGFPCQDLSYAGKQAGFAFTCNECGNEWEYDDEGEPTRCPECGSSRFTAKTRSAMFFEMMRLLDETRENAENQLPAILVAENVKGLKKYIPVLMEELKRHGYSGHIELYNSKHFDVAQNRERYYIIATRQDLPDTVQMPSKQESNPVPKLSAFLDDEVDEKYYIPDEKAQKIIQQALEKLVALGKVHAVLTPDRLEKRQDGRRAKSEEEEMYTLTATDIHGVITEPTILRNARNDYGKAIRKQYESGEVKAKWSDVKSPEPRTDGISNTLTTVLKDNLLIEPSEEIEQMICQESGLLNPDGIGKTLRIAGGGSLSKKHNYQRLLEPRPDQSSRSTFWRECPQRHSRRTAKRKRRILRSKSNASRFRPQGATPRHRRSKRRGGR